MGRISGTQIKAARAMLGWLQENLAEAAGLSITTVRSLETGYLSPRSEARVKDAFEKSGIAFTEDDGVKRRNDMCLVYKGMDSCDRFFDDMRQTIKKRGGDVICAITSQDIMMESGGLPRRNNLERLEIIHEISDVKCVIVESPALPLFTPSFEFRTIQKNRLSYPYAYFVYGNKYVHVVHTGFAGFIFAVFDLPRSAEEHSNHFHALWDMAAPLQESIAPKKYKVLA